MPLDPDEFQELQDILRDAEPAKHLDPKSRQFIADMVARVEQYGDDVRVSTKQWEWLRAIKDRL